MIFLKTFNNSAALVQDDQGQEQVVLGKGVGFGLKKGDKIDESKGVINFMNRLKKVYVCKLPNEKDKDDININPVLIREYSKTEIEKEKDEKKNILVYQLKRALDSLKEEEITTNTEVK